MPACIWEDLERISGLSMGDYTLLNLCLDVHMTCSGASDFPLLDEAVRVLEKARDNWQSSSLERGAAFDDAVLNLVNVAIAEGNAELRRLAEPQNQAVTFSGPFEIEMPA